MTKRNVRPFLRGAAVLTLASALVLGTVACSSEPDEAESQMTAARLRLPQQVVGLQVGAEKVGGDLKGVERPYVDTVAVFSLRDEDLLRASLQVNRFNGAARPDDSGFRETIAGTIGGSTPLTLRVTDKRVYVTSASDQSVFTWFGDDAMFVLSVQKEFEFPRTLLRRLVELDLTV